MCLKLLPFREVFDQMGHPIQGIKGSKPRFAPTLRQMMAEEAAQEERKRKLREERKLRKSAKATPGKAQKPAPAARKSDK
jgi:hypothetical protein